jgi:predicted esterase
MQKKISKLFTKEAWSQYTVLAPNGPYVLEGSDSKGWWPLESPQMYCQPHSYLDHEKALACIQLPTFTDEDELYAIGFSQGASVLEIMVSQKLIVPRKLVLISPSGIMDSKIKRQANCISTLVFMGDKEKDLGITQKHYQKHTTCKRLIFHQHKYGHVIPSDSASKRVLKAHFA